MAAACLCPSPLFPRSPPQRRTAPASCQGGSCLGCICLSLSGSSFPQNPAGLACFRLVLREAPAGRGCPFSLPSLSRLPCVFYSSLIAVEMGWVIIRKLRWSRDFVSSVYPWCLERRSAPVRARGGSKATTCTDPGVWEAQAGAGQLPPEDDTVRFQGDSRPYPEPREAPAPSLRSGSGTAGLAAPPPPRLVGALLLTDVGRPPVCGSVWTLAHRAAAGFEVVH